MEEAFRDVLGEKKMKVICDKNTAYTKEPREETEFCFLNLKNGENNT